MFKCGTCFIYTNDLENGKCPSCGNSVENMCKEDHTCKCNIDIHEGICYCPVCGKPICPCGSHDVSVISRVTGYLSDVKGWNKAKKQELLDRQRY